MVFALCFFVFGFIWFLLLVTGTLLIIEACCAQLLVALGTTRSALLAHSFITDQAGVEAVAAGAGFAEVTVRDAVRAVILFTCFAERGGVTCHQFPTIIAAVAVPVVQCHVGRGGVVRKKD